MPTNNKKQYYRIKNVSDMTSYGGTYYNFVFDTYKELKQAINLAMPSELKIVEILYFDGEFLYKGELHSGKKGGLRVKFK